MGEERKRPYYDRDVATAKRKEREQEQARLIEAFKAAFNFGKAIVVKPSEAAMQAVDDLKKKQR